MRDPERVEWEQDPRRALVQSSAWNWVSFVWFFGLPLVILLMKLLGVLTFSDWKETTAVMMLAAASASLIDIVGWLYERIKYRGR